ncbi:hypothetical protein OSB04_006091 [Centaurea solstitialis]|uniref:Tyrosinase copper-binding domain-containing protein n=1 Tax=Centaurea solstitialis TaxID=347529 RepID=A0AA38WSG6_9ASTR|nr:hypothetical protein OSB04_006091 [Centaurea solstitialis]
MASFATPTTFIAIPATTAAGNTTKRLPNSPFFSTSRQRSNRSTHRSFKVSCNVADDNEKRLESEKRTLLEGHNVDRRNVLLGLGAGGLYSTIKLPSAFADPITTPPISTCKDSTDGIGNIKDRVRPNGCCPPTSLSTPPDYVIPTGQVVRTRPAAHRATPEYVDKYNRAMAAMKALPDDDPRSFTQQAKIHCAYCNGGYAMEFPGNVSKEVQIHNCWLFFPFHRWYLYFFERILGSLIDDPTFALPYWNWDNPSGMSMPGFFEGKFLPNADPSVRVLNPAFDAFRNVEHLPPAIVNMDFRNQASGSYTCVQQIGANLSLTYKQMVSNSPNAATFFGGEYRAGDDPIGMQQSTGPIESGTHTAVHSWVGNSRMPNNEDMGNFYSAGWDPLFYTHHANVDRMWKLWKDMQGPDYPDHTEPTDPDWLNASYLFYDENKNLVRVYNRDSVNMETLGYEYEPSPLPWLRSRPVGRNLNANVAAKSFGTVKKVEETTFPVKLDKTVKVLVKRPATNRSKEDKRKAYELLRVNGIKLDGEKFVKFDVFVNDLDDGTPSTPSDSEFAGSFSQLAHLHGHKMLMTSGATFGLNELLEDIKAESDEYILVTLEPKEGCEDVTVAEIKVELVAKAQTSELRHTKPMASFATPTTFNGIPATTAAGNTTKRLPNSPFFSTSRQRSSRSTHRSFKVSCNVADNNEKRLESEKRTLLEAHNVDRRNVLVGLGAGGLYSTIKLPLAFADPITTPPITTCKESTEGIGNLKDRVRPNACCPPTSLLPVQDYVIPTDAVLRTRPAAHRVTPEYVAKYQKALAAMKALPDDHPHSFVQQAKIHCAYCNGGYFQGGHPDKELQIHNCWLFFPFHRWYLYFFERILGKLIDDPTFALPYWNWDNPSGMSMPAFFEGKYLPNADPSVRVLNPAFDAFRNVEHLPPAILNMDFRNQASAGYTCVQQIGANLTLMYKQMVTNSPNADTFFGGAFRAGDDPLSMQQSTGPIESGVHTAVHAWVGNSRMPNNEDMGNFYSAGWDPLFYTHHANCDRMWTLWKEMEGPDYPDHTEPSDPDWQNASYVFYDENKELVRVYNKDCVNMESLRYEYEPSPIPWLRSRPVGRNQNANVAANSVGTVKKAEDTTFPVKLDKTVKVLVKRPTTKRSKKDKKKSYELLYINGIKLDSEKFVKFDVFVNDVDDGTPSTPSDSEFAGSFSQLAHLHGHKMVMTSGAKFGLNELLEDIKAEDDEYVLVTLEPKEGCEDVTVAEIKIELVSSKNSR